MIHSRFVLTAAHCTLPSRSKSTMEPSWVRIQELDFASDTEVSGTRDVRIIKIYRHPNYLSFYNDIALLKLATFLDFSDNVKPACLHTNHPFEMWKNKLQSIGWGATKLGGGRSDHLLKVNMSFVQYEKCKEKYPKSMRRKNGITGEHHICAGNEFGGDSCQGDSGGPLHFLSRAYYFSDGYFLNPHYVVVGITSFGNGCGGLNSVGVYTKVQTYLKWIEDTIWPICKTEEIFFPDK